MTALERVRYLARCPECGGDAHWHGTHARTGDGTEYRIDCTWCDNPAWSLAAQIARRLARASVALAGSYAIAGLVVLAAAARADRSITEAMEVLD